MVTAWGLRSVIRGSGASAEAEEAQVPAHATMSASARSMLIRVLITTISVHEKVLESCAGPCAWDVGASRRFMTALH
jgi:hypothetical protein